MSAFNSCPCDIWRIDAVTEWFARIRCTDCRDTRDVRGVCGDAESMREQLDALGFSMDEHLFVGPVES